MTIEMWLTLGILALALFLFITEWIRVDVVALGVVVVLMVTGLLNTSEALSGFSNSAVLTIAALFVVGGGVTQTGLAGAIGRKVLQIAGDSKPRLIAVVMIAVALLSGFMSDTGTVAILLPAVISLARSARIAPSQLLIPLAYGSLLGGATTLIGTTPNLIVSDLLSENGFKPLTFFSFTPLGVILVIAGIIFMLTIGRHLLPERESRKDIQRIETPDELVSHYRLPEDLFLLRVRRASPLVGLSLAESGLRSDYDLNVIEVQRSLEPRPLVKLGDNQIFLKSENLQSIKPVHDTILNHNDLLIIKGNPRDVSHAAAVLNLGVQAANQEATSLLINQEAGIAEVLIPPRSSLIGKHITELRFGTRYELTVLGLYGTGNLEAKDLAHTPIQFGDTLLVQGPWEKILALRSQRRDFVVIGQPEEMLGAPMRKKAPIAMLIMLFMLILMIFNVIPVATASMLAAFLVIVSGCLTIDEAYNYIDWKSIVLMAGMLPMSIALEKVGLVSLAANFLTESMGQIAPILVLASLFAATSLFTQVLSNTATTFLIAPIALAAAINMGVQPYGFMMAVAVAASMAFASPVASPVNTLVMGAGAYRFSDFTKTGVLMLVISLILSVLLLPIFFPF